MTRFNTNTREWFNQLITKEMLYSNLPYVQSSAGMLMGMHNACSTTLGLLSVGHNVSAGEGSYQTLRSSDDSLTCFLSQNRTTASMIAQEITNLKLSGINLSPEKTVNCFQVIGEYTSWYIDSDFVSQYGVDTVALRPQGKNPQDDLFFMSRNTYISLQRMECNPLGAELRLRVGIDNIRRLYRINREGSKRPGIRSHILMIADGGDNVWDHSSCHLEEAEMKKHMAESEEEVEYLYQIRNPSNPFSGNPEEDISWDRTLSSLVATLPEVPRSVFTYLKRSNRTCTNLSSLDERRNVERLQRGNALICRIVNMADPGQ